MNRSRVELEAVGSSHIQRNVPNRKSFTFEQVQSIIYVVESLFILLYSYMGISSSVGTIHTGIYLRGTQPGMVSISSSNCRRSCFHHRSCCRQDQHRREGQPCSTSRTCEGRQCSELGQEGENLGQSGRAGRGCHVRWCH